MTEKLQNIIIGEIFGAILFIGILLVASAILPDDQNGHNIMKTIIIIWAIYGIGTPIVIIAELEKEVARFFG